MTREEFLLQLEDILQLDEGTLTLEEALALDSMAQLTFMAFLDSKLNKRITVEQLRQLKTVKDAVAFVGL